MNRKIKKVGNKYHVQDEVLGWIVCDRIEKRGSDQVSSDSPLEYKAVLTLEGFGVSVDDVVRNFRGHHLP